MRPGLAVVLVGHDPASEIYVRNKIKTCGELGIYSEKITPPDSLSTEGFAGHRGRLESAWKEIDGILVQMPLPPQVDKHRILVSVRPDKDVDGFHPVSVGDLVTIIPDPRACTPAGIMEMLRRYEIPVAGKNAVVVGRSDIVGKADGPNAAACERHRNHLPFQDSGSSRSVPPRGYPGGCRLSAALRMTGV